MATTCDNTWINYRNEEFKKSWNENKNKLHLMLFIFVYVSTFTMTVWFLTILHWLSLFIGRPLERWYQSPPGRSWKYHSLIFCNTKWRKQLCKKKENKLTKKISMRSTEQMKMNSQSSKPLLTRQPLSNGRPLSMYPARFKYTMTLL